MKKVLHLKTTLPLIALLFIISCNSVKRVKQTINRGNYDEAINRSVEKLQKNKRKKSNQAHILLLKEAFTKAVERDSNKLLFLQKDNNPENTELIFNLYQKLSKRQQKIKPLLPLRLLKTGKLVSFNFINYQNKIISTKQKLVDHLYNKAITGLRARNTNKLEFRNIYEDFAYLNKLSPNYKNTTSLLKETHMKGTDFVLVTINNQTQKVIPRRLEEDLLDFNTYNLNDFWTVYHSKKGNNVNYDYKLQLDFRKIEISPERVNEKELIKEKELKETVYVKDSLGKKIKSSRLVLARCKIHQITQTKTCDITGNVKYIDMISNQIVETFPISSGFTFSHIYGSHSGNKRVLDNNFLRIITRKEVRFPSNEQMIYDTGKDLKDKLKVIIIKNKFR